LRGGNELPFESWEDLAMHGGKRRLGWALLWSLTLVGLAGEVEARRLKTKPPLFLHSEFKSRGVNDVALLPIVDLREVEKPRNGDSFVRRVVKGMLGGRDYEVTVAEDFGSSAAPTQPDLAKPSPAWISGLGPAKSRWVLLVTIVRLERHITIGAKAEAEIHGYLFDKEKGELLWEGEGSAHVTVGFLLVALAEGSALEEAAKDLMLSFPIKP
jgi:hypothetical protein